MLKPNLTSFRLRQALRLGTAAIAMTAPLAIATPAWAQEVRQYNIAAQDLNSALRAFANATGRDVLYPPELVAGRRSPGVRGRMAEQDALAALLAGTGLRFERTRSNGFVVVSSGSGETEAGSAAAESAGAVAYEGGVSEILVVGSRSQNVDIRRTENDAQPYVVFRSEEIEQSGATNLEDFLRRRLPMNAQQQTSFQGDTSVNPRPTGLSNINLRGLGAGQTLILVDGRRVARARSDSIGGEFQQGDINGIPLEAVERIEVLPATAGGLYGGGAVGGVINIIRKRNYHGLALRAGYDGTFRGGGEVFRAEGSGGFSPDGGDTQISFSGAFVDGRALRGGDNDLLMRARSRFYANNPVTASLPVGRTTNVVAASIFDFPCFLTLTGQGVDPIIASNQCQSTPNLVLDNGRALNSPATYIPGGYGGVSSDNGTALISNAGGYNLDLPDNSSGALSTLLPARRSYSANLNVRRSIGDAIEVFTDVSWSHSTITTASPALGQTTFFLDADDANNPFQQAIIVTLPINYRVPPIVARTSYLDTTGGIVVRFSPRWAATGQYSWGRQRTAADLTAYPLRTQEAAFIFPGSPILDDTVRSGSLNPFNDASVQAFNYSPYALPAGDSRSGPFTTIQEIASLRVSGPILDLPAGSANVTAVAEYRRETAQAASLKFAGSEYVTPNRSQNDSSGSVEFRIPLFAAVNARPLLRILDVQFAARYDSYQTNSASPAYVVIPDPVEFDRVTRNSQSFNYTAAVRWSPIDDIIFRASYSTGFLPPNIQQLTSTPPNFYFPSTSEVDPKRGNRPVNADGTILVVGGGNGSLRPEESRSLSAGIVLTPGAVPGLRLSMDYTRINKSGEIGSLPNNLITVEQLYPDRIVRDSTPLTPEEVALGYSAGRIISADLSLINVARTHVRAWDFQVDYQQDFSRIGTFHFFGVGTLQTDFAKEFLPGSGFTQFTGFSDGPLRFRANLGLEWSRGNLGVAWNTQYYDGYSVTQAQTNDTPIGDAAVIREGRARIPSQIYHDLSIRYRFGEVINLNLRNIELAIGIQNLFGHRPPSLATSTTYGTYSYYGDPRLRRFSISLRAALGR